MKKFYSFLFAAVALVGFAACNSDSTEDQPAPAGAEKLSFKANIDTTKTGLELDENNHNKTTWCKGDVVVIENFEFVCGDDLVTFTCTQTGCTSLLNKEVEAVYSNKKDGKIDSKAGVHGALLKATGELTAEGASFNFAVQNAFLKFTTTGTVTLKADKEIFSTGKELTIEGENKEAVYVAINPLGDVKLSCESFGKEVKPETDVKLDVKKIYNLGNLEAAVFKVYVIPQPGTAYAKWEKVNLYTWVNNVIGLKWPGEDITGNTEEINGYTYYYFEYPAEYLGQIVNVIVNNGSSQTDDILLGELNTNYYVVYSPIINTQVSTTAPAAGSIEEYVAPKNLDPKPDTVTLYLKTTWGWTNWALYAWGGNGTWGDFNKWPGKAKEYDQVIEGVTYKAWDIPESCVGQTGTEVIVTGKENGDKQTKDTPVTFTAGKDVFVEITGWDGTANKASMAVINGPY